jgi:N-methylhydantoinase A
VETPVLQRTDLLAETVIEGPAIVEEEDSTTILGPATTLRVDGTGNLVVHFA